jgi:hypothetical protein
MQRPTLKERYTASTTTASCPTTTIRGAIATSQQHERRSRRTRVHEIRSRKLKNPTRFVDRIVMPSEGENEEGTEGMRRMMRRERAMEQSVQTTHIYEFMQQIHMRHIYIHFRGWVPTDNCEHIQHQRSVLQIREWRRRFRRLWTCYARKRLDN